jgi:ATP-dependent DNA helicase RecG
MYPETLIEEHYRTTPTQKKALSRLGIHSIRELLYHFPHRYTNVPKLTFIRDLVPGEHVVLYGTLDKLKTKRSFRGRVPRAEAKLTDATGSVSVMWFNQPYIAKMLGDGGSVQLTGQVSQSKQGNVYLNNPEVERTKDLPIDVGDSLFRDDAESEALFGYPVYPESRGISSKWLYHHVQDAFRHRIHESIIDPIPSEILNRYHLPSLATALVWIHTPRSPKDAEAARKRFAFEEIFFIQLERQQDKARFASEKARRIGVDRDAVHSFIDRFPFTLTTPQQKAVSTILDDLERDEPMARLLEGDVGSGKTAVAAATAYAVINERTSSKEVDHGQVAYMVPTEILAAQHFESFIQYFRHLPIAIALITSSGCKKFPSKVDPSGATDISRAQLLKWVANGDISIVIGTHSLIQKSVVFRDLSYVIIDEQHRFGTAQRMKLTRKQGHAPHFLSMTATPIPRTLALTIYGDLDLTIIDQMPTGRKPVITQIIKPSERNEVYEAVASQIEVGRQAYVICSRIDEPDPDSEVQLNARSVQAEARRLKKDVFPDLEIGTLHGKMTPAKKDEVMKRFSEGVINILVATSVVEVGVNVPNATMIIIEGAERFGLSQLHQLRGRVIRSEHQAYCYVFTESSADKTLARLKALTEAKNGFELSEMDLSLRGPGDLAGRKQWGISDLGMEAIKNIKMVEAARTEAGRLVKENIDLSDYPVLKEQLSSRGNTHHFE